MKTNIYIDMEKIKNINNTSFIDTELGSEHELSLKTKNV